MSYSTMEALSGGRVVSWGRRSIHAPERKTLKEKTEKTAHLHMAASFTALSWPRI